MAQAIKTAIIGASGFVGRHLFRACRQIHPDCVGTAFSNLGPDLTRFDLRQPDLASLALEESGHQAVVISSAKPNIEFCEREKVAAYAVNVQGTLDLVRQISRTQLQVIFLSSDYVFDGQTGQYDDTASLAPGTEYGCQKARVEQAIPKLTDNYLIIRLSKMIGTEKGDGTLLDELAGSLSAGRRVRAARDQVFSPTHVADFVQAVFQLQARGLKGLFNVCNPESWSRYAIADAMAQALEVDPSLVEAVQLHDIPAMAGRPLNTSLRCSRLKRETNISFTPLRGCIQRVAKNWFN